MEFAIIAWHIFIIPKYIEQKELVANINYFILTFVVGKQVNISLSALQKAQKMYESVDNPDPTSTTASPTSATASDAPMTAALPSTALLGKRPSKFTTTPTTNRSSAFRRPAIVDSSKIPNVVLPVEHSGLDRQKPVQAIGNSKEIITKEVRTELPGPKTSTSCLDIKSFVQPISVLPGF